MHTPTDSTTRHPIVFTGSGVEYRRIWARNMLLIALTLGLYFPWAMVSKFKYFYGHTRVAGQPLAYHASPLPLFWANLIGTVVINGIYYGIAQTGAFAPYGAAGMQILTAAVTPLFLHGFLQFQLSNTSWQDQRMSLSSSAAESFKAMGLPTLLYIGSGALLVWAFLEGRQCHVNHAKGLGLAGLVGLSTALTLMYVRYKSYQHRYAAFGEVVNVTPIRYNDPATLKACLLATCVAVASLLTVALPLALWLSAQVGFNVECLGQPNPGNTTSTWTALWVIVPSVWVGIALVMALPYPYLSVHLQNQLWSNTTHSKIRFESQVPIQPLLRLTAKNWLLIASTLGFYYPYAAVAEARFRLQAVTVLIRGDCP